MISIINNIQKIKQKLSANIEEIIPEESLKEFVTSGKFIRSTLSILYLKSQNYEITNEICRILEAGELLHSASLLHDDVIDNAEIRRNKTTIAKKFDSKISILAGDYLISKAIEKLLEINDNKILENFRNCTEKMSTAEVKQFFLRGQIATSEEYIEICKDKTARLFATILESCAIKTSMNIDSARNFGQLFGIYFQIKNDLEKSSAEIDKNNKIYTATDIFGIEKTTNLLDNYKEEMSNIIDTFPENVYKKELKDLIDSI
jgi:geranylgeranyl pyrophosphate synthase